MSDNVIGKKGTWKKEKYFFKLNLIIDKEDTIIIKKFSKTQESFFFCIRFQFWRSHFVTFAISVRGTDMKIEKLSIPVKLHAIVYEKLMNSYEQLYVTLQVLIIF